MKKILSQLYSVNIYWELAGLFIYYILLSTQGYGNDNDNFGMLNTWQVLINEHRYHPSRFQGCLVPELLIGIFSHLGGFYLSNLVSAVVSVISLFLFGRVLEKINFKNIAGLAILAIGLNPFYALASATSNDFIYGVFFFAIGLLLLCQHKIRTASLIFALAVSSRITYGPMVLIAFVLYFPYIKTEIKSRNRFFQGLIIFFIATFLLYLPTFVISGYTLSRFSSADKGTYLSNIARFVYKNFYFWGLPSSLLLIYLFIRKRVELINRVITNPFQNLSFEKTILHESLWWFIYNEAMYAILPHDRFYLLPTLFCIILILTYILKTTREKNFYLSSIVVLSIVFSIVNFNFLNIDYTTNTPEKGVNPKSAQFGFSIQPGIIVDDLQNRDTWQQEYWERHKKKWNLAK